MARSTSPRPARPASCDDLLREFAPLFATDAGGGPYWHLGGDEYLALTVRDPEDIFPQLARHAERRYGSGARVRDLATGWLNDRAKAAREAGARVKSWNDGLFRGGVVRADKDREVEYWTGKEIGARQPEEYLREGRPVINVNDEYLYYVLGEPNDFAYPTGKRIYEEWSPRVLRGSESVPAALGGRDRVLGGRFGIWCDIADAQTPETDRARHPRAPARAGAARVGSPRAPRALGAVRGAGRAGGGPVAGGTWRPTGPAGLPRGRAPLVTPCSRVGRTKALVRVSSQARAGVKLKTVGAATPHRRGPDRRTRRTRVRARITYSATRLECVTPASRTGLDAP